MDIIKLYTSGLSIPQVREKTGVALSTIRNRLKKAGVLRSRKDGILIASENGRLGSGFRGKERVFSEEHKENISKGRKRWGDKNAKGISLKKNGYVQITTGEDIHRGYHVTVMEKRIGRKLLPDECVHHIDRNRSNNEINNLALLTKSAHARLHRFEDKLEGKERNRDKNGRLS